MYFKTRRPDHNLELGEIQFTRLRALEAAGAAAAAAVARIRRG